MIFLRIGQKIKPLKNLDNFINTTLTLKKDTDRPS